MITAKKKPSKCPQCGSPKVARILYGLPDFSPQLQKDLKSGKIVLGGCCVTDSDPTWQCVECETQVYRADDVAGGQGED